jgi:hypothetical protein
MVHTIQNLKTLNLNPGFEFQQLLVSLKYVINLVMWIRDMWCHRGRPRHGGTCCRDFCIGGCYDAG